MAIASRWYTPPLPADAALLGAVVFCHQCREWWPADAEFFYFDKAHGRYRSPCRACQLEQKRRKREEGK